MALLLSVEMTISCAQFDQAIGLRPRLDSTEVLLRQGEYEQAMRQFTKDNSDRAPVYYRANLQMKATIKWMRELDRDLVAIEGFDPDQIDGLRVNEGSITLGGRAVRPNNTLVRIKPKSFPPFSPEFFDYLNARTHELTTGYNSIVRQYNEHLPALREQRQREAERQEADQLRRTQEAEQQARRQKAEEARRVAERKVLKEREVREEREAQKAREDEVVRLNQVALAAGYAGYEDTNILSMIGKTQRDGGLEDYLGKVIGCHRLSKEDQDGRNYCERRYPSMRILQVGEETLLYQFHTGYAFLVHKEAGKLYQEGQRFDGSR